MSTLYKIFFTIAVVTMIVCAGIIAIFGFNLGNDFKGGSLMEVEFTLQSNGAFEFISKPTIEQFKEVIKNTLGDNLTIVKTGDYGYLIKADAISEPEHQQLLGEIKNNLGAFEEKRFDSVGPNIGKELKNKSIAAIVVTLIFICIYLAIVFKKVGRVINPWTLGVGAILALLHDLLLPFGIFALLGKLNGMEIDASFIAVALTILGYSVNDTVVVYDRVRENILKKEPGTFDQIVHKSVKQTISRSINTIIAVLLSLVAIYFFGGTSLKNFSLAMIIGIISGAYSSIFVASPILMLFHKEKKK